MKMNMRKFMGIVLAFALLLGVSVPDVQAAKVVKLSTKKVSITVGTTKTIKVMNTKKTTKWSVKSGAKYVKLSAKKKTSVKVKGVKAGKTTILARVAKKKLTCTITVKKATVKETTAPVETVVPTTAPTQIPTTAPSESVAPTQTPDSSSVVGQPVPNITIDLSKLTTSFTATPSYINFASQIDKNFDLSLYASCKVTFEYTIDGDAMTDFKMTKYSLSPNASSLTGYADGVAMVYDEAGTNGTVSIDLSGDAITGPVAGLNIQPMNSSWAKPENLTSWKVTKIEFIANAGAVYPDPNAKPTATPVPTFAPTDFEYENTDISWIDTSKPMVAFTFDDGPIGTANTDTSMIIQNALHNKGCHATFNYIGSQINTTAKENEIKQANEFGFEIGNHSYGWDGLSGSTATQIRDSIDKTNTILKRLTGLKKFTFRAPNLDTKGVVIGNINAPIIDCNCYSNDWVDGTTTAQILANVKAAKDGDIVLMHETQAATAEAIPQLIQYFQDKGWQIVSVSELYKARGVTMQTDKIYKSCPPQS